MTKKKQTITSLMARKQTGPKLVVVTAYDATMAELLDRGGADILMVGDSLGMVVQGHDTTLSVTLEHMIYHCSAVTRSRPSAHVVCDLPFMTYQVGPEQALVSAGRLVKEGGAESVKLEGGQRMVPTIEKIVAAGIPVMGHIGLTPQSVHQMGGFKIQGRERKAADRLVDDARALEAAGIYALVVEGVPSDVGERITRAVAVPTIGIGAGAATDGQVLVSYDLLGMYGALSPKFVKRYASLADQIVEAMSRYREEVRDGRFPAEEHSFAPTESTSPQPYGGKGHNS